MAGYMSKLNSYLYEGEYTAKQDIEIGAFVAASVTPADGKTMDLAAIAGAKFVCTEVGTIYGDTKAARYTCIAVDPAAAAYFVEESLCHYGDESTYDLTKDKVKAGDFLRAHPVSVGEELWQSIQGTTDPVVGTTYTVPATGYLA